MARIRTLKPEFFTSEDITDLPAFARLLYQALWCEADREGRLVWKPRTFKMRYFPADEIDINELCDLVVKQGLVVLYGDGLAYIPSFLKHQHINPRETQSALPEPRVEHASSTRGARDSDGESTVSDAQVGRERKGSIDTRVEHSSPPTPSKPKTKKTELPDGFGISPRVEVWATSRGYGTRYMACQLEALVSHARRNGARYVDWDEALMTAARDNWAKAGETKPATADIFAGGI